MHSQQPPGGRSRTIGSTCAFTTTTKSRDASRTPAVCFIRLNWRFSFFRLNLPAFLHGWLFFAVAAVPFVQIPATHACCVFHSRSAFVLSGYKKAQISLCCCVLLHDNIEETCSRQAQKQHSFDRPSFKKKGVTGSRSLYTRIRFRTHRTCLGTLFTERLAPCEV